MIQKALKRTVQIILVPIICGIIGLVLLAIAFLLPKRSITSHVKASTPILSQETDYYSVTPNLKGSQLDNYTDAIYLNEALVNIQDANIMDCILSGYQLESTVSSGAFPVETLANVTADPQSTFLQNTSRRFFNGYEIIVKLLLVFTDYSGIRFINMILGLFLTVWLLYLMFKRNLHCYIIPTIISFLFLRPLTLCLSMTLFGFFACMLIPCIIILLLQKEVLVERGWLLFGVTGAAVYYFNVNYIQLLSFAIPLLFYFLVIGISQKPIDLIKASIYYFLSWLVGCVGMMVFKWIVYAIFIDPEIFQMALGHFEGRTSESAGSRLWAIWINCRTAFGNPWMDLLEFGYIVYSIYKFIKSKNTISITLSEIVLLILLILLPVSRCLILSNHVIVHNWVTYRLFIIPLFAFNILLTSTQKQHSMIPFQNRKHGNYP